MRIKWLRISTATVALGVMLWGAACKVGIGTVCSLNVAGVPFTCPLGYLEAALASRSWLPQLWLGVGLVLLSVILFGRFFCAWVCPTAILRQLFGTRPSTEHWVKRANGNHIVPTNPVVPLAETTAPANSKDSGSAYTGLAVLGGTLVSSFAFGFPVFCLICPVGLFYGTLFAFGRLVFANEPTGELVIFPLILGLELFGLRKWCSSICPLGALLGLLARFNHTLRLQVRHDQCLASQGIQCKVCERVCLYGFNISKEETRFAVNACAKCFECFENCPTKAIRLGVAK
jgi:ferredoxin-type protein NapH